MTRYLGELGCDVVAVEGSGRRAAIAASRCVDLSNVAVVADAFDRVPSGAAFDVVTLIGVAEYARVHSRDGTGDPVDALLERAARFLKPGGILVLAIENQLGLKYFSGCREDHVGQPMFGIEDRYTGDSVVTFGRRELAGRMKRAGLQNQEWWFPQPDYKLPICALSDRLEDENVTADLSSLLSESARAEAQPADAPVFSLEQAWRPVYRNRLWADLANSFLVVGSRNPLPKHNTLAEYYGHERLPAYNKLIRFEWADPKVIVRREPMSAAAPASSLPVSIHLEDETMFAGENWHATLVRLLNRDGWSADEWTNWARRWFDAVLENAGLPLAPVPPPAQELPGRLLDAIPRNMLVREGGVVEFFDQEWRAEAPVELGYLVYRAMHDALSGVSAAARPAPGTSMGISQLMLCFTRSLGWEVSPDDFRRYHGIEARFQKMVGGWDALDIAALHRQLPAKARIESMQQLSSRLARAEEETLEARSLLSAAAEQANLKLASARNEVDGLLGRVAALEQRSASQQAAIAELHGALDQAEAAIAYLGDRGSRRPATIQASPFSRGLGRLWRKRPNVPQSLYALVREFGVFRRRLLPRRQPGREAGGRRSRPPLYPQRQRRGPVSRSRPLRDRIPPPTP